MLLEILITAHGVYGKDGRFFSKWLVKFILSIGKEEKQCYTCIYPEYYGGGSRPCVRVASSTTREECAHCGCYISLTVTTLQNGSDVYQMSRGVLRDKSDGYFATCETVIEDNTNIMMVHYPNLEIKVFCEICNTSLCTAGEQQLENRIPEEVAQTEMDIIFRETGSTPKYTVAKKPGNTLGNKTKNTPPKPNKTSKILCSCSTILVLLFLIFKKE